MAKVPKEFGSKVQGKLLDSPIVLKLNLYIALSKGLFENKLNPGLVESPWGSKESRWLGEKKCCTIKAFFGEIQLIKY